MSKIVIRQDCDIPAEMVAAVVSIAASLARIAAALEAGPGFARPPAGVAMAAETETEFGADGGGSALGMIAEAPDATAPDPGRPADASPSAAEAGEPAPPPPMGRPPAWSAAQLELLAREFPTEKALEDVWAAFNAVEGGRHCASAESMRMLALRMGLRRPAGMQSQGGRRGAEIVNARKAEQEASAPAPAAAADIEADFAAIRTWAGPRGLPFDRADDLARVNAKRRALCLPLFRLVTPAMRRGVAA